MFIATKSPCKAELSHFGQFVIYTVLYWVAVAKKENVSVWRSFCSGEYHKLDGLESALSWISKAL